MKCGCYFPDIPFDSTITIVSQNHNQVVLILSGSQCMPAGEINPCMERDMETNRTSIETAAMILNQSRLCLCLQNSIQWLLPRTSLGTGGDWYNRPTIE